MDISKLRGWSQAGKLEKLSVAQLKGALKDLQLIQTGEKATLLWRIRSFLDGEDHKIDGQNPWRLKLPELRKQTGRRQLNVIGSQDELMERLIGHLKQFSSSSSSSSEDGADKENQAVGKPTNLDGVDDDVDAVGGEKPKSAVKPLSEVQMAIRIAQEVIRLSADAEYVQVLRLLGDDVAKDSPTGLLRKAYLKLSLMIHPDKLGPKFPSATTAFQGLVRSFEALTRPELAKETAPVSKKKASMISRSNEGCFKTQIICPRCKIEWGQSIEGNPEYFYTLMMMGVKTFHCATCLLEFGCMAAIHKCPFCRKSFEYSPEDYHRKISCGNGGCKREFGFWLHYISERVMNDLRAEIRSAQEQRMKQEEASRRRAKMAARRFGDDPGDAEQMKFQEKMFIAGLRDECPRCGVVLEGLGDELEQRRHLRECTDTKQHAEYRKRMAERAAKEEKKAQVQAKQASVSNLAAFDILGGRATQLWMLEDTHLRTRCSQAGLDCTGSREDMIARLAAHMNDQKLLTDGGSGATSSSGSHTVEEDDNAGVDDDVEAMPSNPEAMSLEQLRAVCLAHGIRIPPNACKADLVDMLVVRRFNAATGLGKKQTMLLLTDGRGKGGGGSNGGGADRAYSGSSRKRPRSPSVSSVSSSSSSSNSVRMDAAESVSSGSGAE